MALFPICDKTELIGSRGMTITKINPPDEGDLEYHLAFNRLLICYRKYQDNQAI